MWERVVARCAEIAETAPASPLRRPLAPAHAPCSRCVIGMAREKRQARVSVVAHRRDAVPERENVSGSNASGASPPKAAGGAVAPASRGGQGAPFLVAAAAVLGVSVLGSCLPGPERECEKADEYCADGIAYTCVEYEAGARNGSRWHPVPCASPGRCQTFEYGAFCTLDATPDPKCAGQTVLVCDGTEAVRCQVGYRVEWSVCSVCDAEQATCAEGLWKPCDHTACLPGLECVDGFCEIPCSCPEGAECPACSQYGAKAGHVFLCEGNICRLEVDSQSTLP